MKSERVQKRQDKSNDKANIEEVKMGDGPMEVDHSSLKKQLQISNKIDFVPSQLEIPAEFDITDGVDELASPIDRYAHLKIEQRPININIIGMSDLNKPQTTRCFLFLENQE